MTRASYKCYYALFLCKQLFRIDLFIPGVDVVGGFSICSPPHQLVTEQTIRLAIKSSPHPPAQWMCSKVVSIFIVVHAQTNAHICMHRYCTQTHTCTYCTHTYRHTCAYLHALTCTRTHIITFRNPSISIFSKY